MLTKFANVTSILLFSFLQAGPILAQAPVQKNPPAQPTKNPATVPKSATPSPEWIEVKVPDTSDPALLAKFVTLTKQRKPQSPEQYLDMQRGIRQASKKILELIKDTSSEDYASAEIDFVSSSVLLLGNDGLEAQQKTVDRFKEYLAKKEKLSSTELQMIILAGQNLEQLDDLTIARDAYNQFAEILEAKKDDTLVSFIALIRANVKRLELIDHPLNLKGSTIDGEPFDLQSLTDQYVLVCFWASFSPPAMLEMKSLKNIYVSYHDKGFEIVSICMDDDRNKAKTAIKELNAPWIHLWDQDDPSENRISLEIGISAVPSMIFLDKGNKVTSLEVNSAMLKKGLEELFNPPPETNPDSKTDNPSKKVKDPPVNK